MKASDLDYSMRQKMLEMAREKLGDSQYYSMLGQVGEDGILDAMLQGHKEPEQKNTSCWVPLVYAVMLIIAYIIGLSWLSGGKPLEVWHYFAGVPLGLFVYDWYFNGWGVTLAILGWFFIVFNILLVVGIPAASIFLTYMLNSRNLTPWVLAEGVIIFLLGSLLALGARKWRTRSWALGTLGAYLFGIGLFLYAGVRLVFHI